MIVTPVKAEKEEPSFKIPFFPAKRTAPGHVQFGFIYEWIC